MYNCCEKAFHTFCNSCFFLIVRLNSAQLEKEASCELCAHSVKNIPNNNYCFITFYSKSADK